jgi:hypothetical protein
MSIPDSLFPQNGTLEAKLAQDAFAGAYNKRELDVIGRITLNPEIIKAAKRVQDREAHALDQLSPWTADIRHGGSTHDDP